MLGGQVGIGDHINIGEGAMVGGKSGVISDVPAGARWAGYPARPRVEWLRGAAELRRLAVRGAAARPDSQRLSDGDTE